MRYAMVVLLAVGAIGCAATSARETADAAKPDAASLEQSYLRAWYELRVEENAGSAKRRFEALLTEELSADRRLMCRLGIADCLSRSGEKSEAIRRVAALSADAGGSPEVARRVASLRDELGPGRHEGTFEFHYQQGFDFRRDEVVDGGGDLVFASCAGGIASIRFAAPGGIVNLERALRRRRTGLDAKRLFEALVGFPGEEPGRAVELGDSATGDSRSPESDVFVMRTSDGAWVKLAIVARGEARSWTEYPATVRYRYDPDGPWFEDPSHVATVVGGVAFDREPKATAADTAAIAAERKAAAAAEAARRARRLREAWEATAEIETEGDVPDPATDQRVLLARQRFHDYEKATLSLEFGIRDDPDRKRTRNRWELQFGNGRDWFSVRMVGGDRSTITDLGESTWRALGARDAVEEGRDTDLPALYRHVYLVRTEHDAAPYFSYVRVAAIRPGVACLVEWATFRNGTLRTSPGLELGAATRASLARKLEAHRKRADRR